jgi:EAL domain-containing protein (putative c-di-GMP-specific phosphodiesterase class I)
VAVAPQRLTVAVNLSPAQFASGSIVDAVAKALKESGLKPHRLELEITETLLLANTETTMATLRRPWARRLSWTTSALATQA